MLFQQPDPFTLVKFHLECDPDHFLKWWAFTSGLSRSDSYRIGENRWSDQVNRPFRFLSFICSLLFGCPFVSVYSLVLLTFVCSLFYLLICPAFTRLFIYSCLFVFIFLFYFYSFIILSFFPSVPSILSHLLFFLFYPFSCSCICSYYFLSVSRSFFHFCFVCFICSFAFILIHCCFFVFSYSFSCFTFLFNCLFINFFLFYLPPQFLSHFVCLLLCFVHSPFLFWFNSL